MVPEDILALAAFISIAALLLFALLLGRNIVAHMFGWDKQQARLNKLAKLHNFQTHSHFNTQQWTTNIEQSGFLELLFGNWKNLHGHIKPMRFRATTTQKGYSIELFRFHIQFKPDVSQNKKAKTQVERLTHHTFGPYTGMHFNLHNTYPEVDVLYKPSVKIRRIIDAIMGDDTIKPHTWSTESIAFNKQYAILSDHHLTNLTVLTPDVMMLMLESRLNMNIEIINNHLLVYTHSSIKHMHDFHEMLVVGHRIAENLE